MTTTAAGAQPILLAFSGGLDTSFCVPWIAETYGSTAEAPIERGDQGRFEIREPLALEDWQ